MKQLKLNEKEFHQAFGKWSYIYKFLKEGGDFSNASISPSDIKNEVEVGTVRLHQACGYCHARWRLQGHGYTSCEGCYIFQSKLGCKENETPYYYILHQGIKALEGKRWNRNKVLRASKKLLKGIEKHGKELGYLD